MHRLDLPGEPWTEEDYEEYYNRMNPEDAEYYRDNDTLRSLNSAISTLERATEELKQKRDAIRNSRN